MNKKEFLTEFFREITGAGYADIDNIYIKMKNFQIGFEDIDLFRAINRSKIYNTQVQNELLGEIYLAAIEKNDIMNWKFEIYTNALDSHLYINSQEAFDQNDIEEIMHPESK